MAELVNLRLEHTLAELEEMTRVGLFNKNEIRSIVKRRKDCEYKLRRNMKRKDDFIKYIEFEMNLLCLIGKRRERFVCDSKKTEIDGSVARRINKLFKGALSRYPEDEKLWLDQIQFCKKMKLFETISALFTRMLQVHSKNPDLWITAAKWEIEDNRSPENARKLLQRGVLMNPDSEILWREYFRMELMYIDLIRKRRAILKNHSMREIKTDDDDVVLSGQVANVVYDTAVESFDDVGYALSFIQICLEFDFGGQQIEHILNDVQERFPDNEETFDALAKKPLLNIEEKVTKGKEMGIKKKATLEKINQEIIESYEEAVNIHPTEKMWSFYIDFILSLLVSVKEKKKKKLQDKAIDVMKRADSTCGLGITHYSELMDLLFETGEEEEALTTSLQVARKFNQVDVWFRCVTYHIQCMRCPKEVYTILEEAINSVKEKDSVTLWKLGVDWLSICDPEKLIEFFETGIRKRQEICVPLKEMYLEATALRKGIEEARILYKKLKKIGPLSPHIFKKMIKIEKGQVSAPAEMLRKYYEDGIQKFGSTNIDIWLDYMKLEIDHKDGQPSNYAALYWKAKKALKPDCLQEFQSRVMELTSGCDIPPNLLLNV